MVRLEETKKTKYVVLIGWFGRYFCDTLQEANELLHRFENAELKTYEQYLNWVNY